MKLNYKTAWLILLMIALAVFAVIAIPVWLIQPFAPQTEKGLQISYLLKSWSPLLTIFAALVSVGLCVFIWSESRRWLAKAFLIFPLLIVFACVWFARQNHFEWMFNPLAQSAYARANQTDFVADDDMVLAIEIGGEAVAYPVRQMAYHHIVQDVATY